MKRLTLRAIAAVACILVVAGACAAFGSGSTTSRDANKDIVVNVDDQVPAGASPRQHHARKPHAVKLVTFSGRQYNCTPSADAALSPVKAKIAVRAKRAYALRSALRKMDRKYPHGAPSEAIVAHARALLHRFNLARHAASGALHKYNRLLREECDAS